MRKIKFWQFALIAILTILFAATWAEAQMPVPPDFKFEQVTGLGPVTFSHEKHVAKGLQCTDCHTKVFQMKKGATTGGKPILMADINAGKYCGTCHNGKTAFAPANCVMCHAQP